MSEKTGNVSNEKYRSEMVKDIYAHLTIIVMLGGFFTYIALGTARNIGEFLYTLGIGLIFCSYSLGVLIISIIKLRKNKKREKKKGHPLTLLPYSSEQRFIGVVTGATPRDDSSNRPKYSDDMLVEVYNRKGDILRVPATPDGGPYEIGDQVVLVRDGSKWKILQYYVPGMIVEGLIYYDAEIMAQKGIQISTL